MRRVPRTVVLASDQRSFCRIARHDRCGETCFRKNLNIIVPYYGYARQERKAAPREPISAKMLADVLTTVGANRVITIDLHAPAIQGFFNIPVDHLTALDLISDYLKSKEH